ncbi:E3 ubiquitin-protein ligase RNF25 isoform X2 [Pseudoliparis swirei]|uniref:E3 ubiquitin-protein ligase RNF25 isoform X2 n=1 Tax=Pseudoliparis swirei TaxID=2059687 RepID=UPI0024BE128A|nr:E3 ubiquitin-protein ligase RNF25 isoform X2 [Pseudoliparis swirei]
MAESDVLSEIEVLESIYLDELLVDRRPDGIWEVSLVLYPSTAEDSVSQFVRLTLTLTLDQQYPSSSPDIAIHNPRGLSDDKISSVQKCLQLEAQSCLGSPVLYQLIEKAKEILTESNIPHGNCVICLYGFKEGETFSKTSCYHYFHSHCLGRYASHSERELLQREKELQEDKTRGGPAQQELTVVCPVCREPLTYDVDQLLRCPAPQLPELDGAAIGSTFQHKWRKLQKLLERQKARGGVIDPEAESNRFLIHTNEAPAPAAENENLDPDAPPGVRVPSCEGDRFVPEPSHCRGGPAQRCQNQTRGPRGGGRSAPHHHRRPPHVPDHLDKLSLYTGGPITAQGHRPPGSGGSAEPRETPPPSADGRGPPGSRRGPRKLDSDGGVRGRHHWEGHAPRSRRGPGGLDRGGGGAMTKGNRRDQNQNQLLLPVSGGLADFD